MTSAGHPPEVRVGDRAEILGQIGPLQQQPLNLRGNPAPIGVLLRVQEQRLPGDVFVLAMPSPDEHLLEQRLLGRDLAPELVDALQIGHLPIGSAQNDRDGEPFVRRWLRRHDG